MQRLTSSLLALLSLVSVQAFAETLKYENVPNFFDAQPGGAQAGPCHGGVAIDKAGNHYVTTDSARGILVFSHDGKFLRACGPSKLHSIEIREDGGTEFIYGARGREHEVVKLQLHGTQVWAIKYPEESGKCKDATGFNPCAVTVGPDGSVFVADGYGSNFIYKFDKDRKFVKAFGGPGEAEGQFKTCHGIALDMRGEKPLLFVCNRNNNRVEHWDLDGNFVRVIQRDLRMPAAVQIRGELAIVPELQGRVTVIDKSGAIAAQVGDQPEVKFRANFGLKPESWKDGITNSPHGAAIDKDGNLIVSEWSQFGRLHKYQKKN